MGMATAQRMSLKEFLALPDDGLQHELLNGEHIVMPPPTFWHERAFVEFLRVLSVVVGDRADIEVLGSRADLRLNPESSVEPDVFVFRSGPGRHRQPWESVAIPPLVVEILSPSTAGYVRGKKRLAYLKAGVEEYWIVDLEAKAVERWRQGFTQAEIVSGELVFVLSVGLSGSIDLLEVFGRIER